MNLAAQPLDYWWLCAGALVLGAAALAAWVRAAGPEGAAGRVPDTSAMRLLDLAIAVLAVGIALRWARIGHGPFLSMFEVLASSMVSLGLGWRIAAWRVPVLTDGSPLALSLLALMAGWMLAVSPADTHLPATYEMWVMWFHIFLGKIFLACALVATGLAGVVLARTNAHGRRWFGRMPGDAVLDAIAWRFMLVALLFESLMLIAGAVWAQDAWGRYWDWDPLETWSFITWLALVLASHARITWRVTPRRGALLIVGVFVIAFLTFFGVPFVTLAPHKGAI